MDNDGRGLVRVHWGGGGGGDREEEVESPNVAMPYTGGDSIACY